MDKIAIIGLGCLFPEAHSPEQFFDLLMRKRDVTTPLTAGELGVDPGFYFHPQPGTPDKIGYHANGYVRGFRFDPRGYRIDADRLASLDRIYQWPLYAAGQALQDSGYRNPGATCGLILGNPAFPTQSSKRIFSRMHHLAMQPYLRELLHRPDFALAGEQPEDPSGFNARTTGLPAGVAARALGLAGPCYEVDAACATSLYAVQLASWHLLSGQADLMLAGAVCCPDPLYVAHGFQMLRAFPPAGGRSLPFDRSSQGLKIGEGAAFLVLKRLSQALRDRDRIRAIVETIGLSNDGRAKHILMPSSAGQILALERAYGRGPRRIDYIECHATGTPLGDKAEMDTLERVFGGARSVPLLGGNKANIGHTLTVAGMASLIKVIMSMEGGMIPATIGVENAIRSPRGLLGEEHIIRDSIEWPQRGGRKVAGINAFGFGGINAHLVLTGAVKKSSGRIRPSPKNTPAFEQVAIVGMHGRWGNLDGAEALDDLIRLGGRNCHPLTPERWIGAERNRDLLKAFGFPNGEAPIGSYCDAFNLDCLRFKIPPQEVAQPLYNHLLMLHVADGALRDAGFRLTGESRNVAVIVGSGMDWANHRSLTRVELPLILERKLRESGIELSPEQKALLASIAKDAICPEPRLEGTTGGIGNLAASRIASVWNFTGPCLVVSSGENSFYQGLQMARFLLTFDPHIEAVVLGAIDLAGGLEHVLWHAQRRLLFRAAEGSAVGGVYGGGMNIGEGAGALVLKRERECGADRIYARLRALRIVPSGDRGGMSSEPVQVVRACRDALNEAGLSPERIGYLEAGSSGIEADKAEPAGLAEVYGRSHCPVIGSIEANIGRTFAASGAAAMMKAALCLYHGYIPGVPAGSAPETRSEAPFGMPEASRPWTGPGRLAAVNGIGMDGSCAHAILEAPTEEQRQAAKPAPGDPEENRGRFSKRLSNGWTPLETFILNEAHRHRFPLPVSQPAVPSGIQPIQRYFETALRRNTETQLIYSQIKEAFRERLCSALASGFEPMQAVADPPTQDCRALLAMTGSGSANPQAARQALTPSADSFPPVALKKPPPGRSVLWDAGQIREMTEGRPSLVLGPEYRDLDGYAVRARLPSVPFQFVSRVTALSAEPDALKPCRIEWEYDIPREAWYVTNGMVPGIVPFESSHALILALSYIGCDRLFKGEGRYRALDSKVTFLGTAPNPGDTLRGQAEIHMFLKSGRSLLIFYEYRCSIGNREILRIQANAGFFSPEDLKTVRGWPARKSRPGEKGSAGAFAPLLPCRKAAFTDDEIQALQRGDFAACFGKAYVPQAPGRLSAPPLQMLDRIVAVDPAGGAWGLGELIGEKDITTDHWAFAAHFKNDPVLPGTLLIEGCNQLLFFYMYYLGLHARFKRLRIDFLQGNISTAKFRGEVKPASTRIRFRLQVRRIETIPETRAAADVEIIQEGKVIGMIENLAATFYEGGR